MLIRFLIILTLLSSTAWPQAGRTYRFFKKERTKIKKPFELRDPFTKKSKKVISTKQEKKKFGNSFSNRGQLIIRELQDIKIVGIFLGKDRKALAKKVEGTDPDGSPKLGKQVFILKEGMNLGRNRAEVKAILPGGVVLVERIRNVYEQEELLETILPLYSSN